MAQGPLRTPVLENFLHHRLYFTASAIIRHLSQEYRARYNLSVEAVRVVEILGALGAQSQRSLCRITQADKQTIATVCKELIRRGYVFKRVNPADARSFDLDLTLEGRDLADQVLPLARRLEHNVFTDLSPADLLELRTLIAKVQSGVLNASASPLIEWRAAAPGPADPTIAPTPRSRQPGEHGAR